MKIAILCAVFNRFETTELGLRSVLDSLRLTPHSFDIFVLDDNSPDDTGRRVTEILPDVRLIRGPGDLYWNRGMCAAFEAARSSDNYDVYLLFNDDVSVFPNAGPSIIAEYLLLNEIRPTIVVGSTISKVTGTTTYSAFTERSRLRALDFEAIGHVNANTPCDTFNGNFVLVPGPFFTSVNGLDPKYHHGLGDIDLGLVARDAGIPSVLFKEPIGFCEKGPQLQDRLRGATFAQRRKLLFSPLNGLGPYSHFVWKHRPRPFFPIYLALHLSKKWINLLFARRPADHRMTSP